MATYTIDGDEVAVHETLAMNTVDTVEFDVADREIEVLNRVGTDEIYFTIDGTTPTVGGENCYVLPAAMGSLKVPVRASTTVVKLISASACEYSVTR